MGVDLSLPILQTGDRVVLSTVLCTQVMGTVSCNLCMVRFFRFAGFHERGKRGFARREELSVPAV